MDTSVARPAVAGPGALGRLPVLSLVAALGLLVISVADTLSRLDLPGASIIWWVGLLVIVAPIGHRLLLGDAGRRERVGLVVLVGLALYMVKVLGSPDAFVMLDESLHWATLDDIVVSGRLFTTNNILLASPYYPGLEIAADLLVRSGFSVWEAGVVIVGAARLLMMLALYLLYEQASRDARIASVAVLVYAANPGFLFFDAQFAYESLALPLALFVVWCVQRRETGGAGHPLSFTVALLLGIASVVVTHHISAMALSAFLVVWAVVDTLLRLRGTRTGGIVGPAVMSLIATLAWMLYVAWVTVGYLVPALSGAVDQVFTLIAGDEGSRELFRSATGVAAPMWEQVIAYGSVGVLVVALLIGLPVVWRRWGRMSLPMTLALVALLYPASLVARLTARGAEIAQRSAEFIFVGAAFVAAVAALVVVDAAREGRLPRLGALRPRLSRMLAAGVMAGLIVLFMGGAILGIAPWARLPGPFLVSADPRSVSPQGIDAASWTLDSLGPGRRFLADRTNRVLLATYGRQHPISASGDGFNLRPAYFSTALTPEELDLLVRAGVDYVIADFRLPTSLPYVGVYIERGEQFTSGPWASPMPEEALAKWATLPGVDQVYDNGAIRIFDIRRLTGRTR